MGCFNGRHDLTEIMRRPIGNAPSAANVVRWCVQCGAVVVDDDVDGQTYPGGFMRMRLPRNAGVQAPSRVGLEGWKRLAESLRALGETDDRIKELVRRYGLDTDGVSRPADQTFPPHTPMDRKAKPE